MIVKRGDVVASDFGTGPVVAITKEWVIHRIENGDEVAIHRENNWVGVPAQFPEEDVDENAELEV